MLVEIGTDYLTARVAWMQHHFITAIMLNNPELEKYTFIKTVRDYGTNSLYPLP